MMTSTSLRQEKRPPSTLGKESAVVQEIDAALRSEESRSWAEEEPSRDRSESALTRLPGIMRGVGAGAVIVAGALFMLQGIHSIGFMSRHWIFLGITTGLGILGLVLGTRLKETRGARTFLGLAVASLPVLFSQLGAMIHSLVATGKVTSMPDMFIVNSSSPSAVALTAAATLLVTIPLVGLGFMVLVRPRAWILTVTHFAANACILLPGRHPTQVGFIVLTMTVLVYLVDTAYLRSQPLLRTKEGLFSRLMLTAPALTILVRALFGDVTATFLGFVLGAVGFAAFFVTGGTALKSGVKHTIQGSGAGCMSIACMILTVATVEELLFLNLGMLFVAAIPVAGLLFFLSTQVDSRTVGRVYRLLGAFGLFLTIATTQMFGAETWVSILSICSGALLIAIGLVFRQKSVFLFGVFGGGIGVVSATFSAVTFNAASVWAIPAGLGVLILAGASVIEMRRNTIAHAIRKWNSIWDDTRDAEGSPGK